MDPSSLSIYQHPRLPMIGQSHIGSDLGSVPINVPMGVTSQGVVGIPGTQMTESHTNFIHKIHANKISAQQHYNQLPLRKEVDDEGRICGLVLPETPTQISMEGKDEGDWTDSQEQIKSEEEENMSFLEAAHDIFLKVSSKEMTLKAASEKLERPYSFVYSRFQEFCDKITGKDPTEKKNTPIIKKNGRKKRKPKKLTITKGKPRRGKIFKCEDCPATFYSAYLIKAHSKVHEGDSESHTCTACGVVFPKLIKLMRHRIEFHQEALQCPHCDSQFTIVASYRYHIRAHSGEKPFVCKECGKGFYSKFTLQHHHRLHTGEKPYMCGYCEKSFIALNNLKAHMFVHTGDRERNHECEVCGQKYQYRASLREHMNIHTGAKPYSCELCDERFNFKANLARHKMTHTGEQPYACDLCPATFYVPIDLKRHKISHTGLKPYKCDKCDYACTRKSNLVFHRNTHTGETPYKCDYYGCNAEYANPKSLKKHKLKHGPPPPQICKVCHEKFADLISLKRHMMIHTGEKPFTCDQCFKVCVDQSSLKRHMFKHMYRPLAQKTKQVRQSKKNPNPSPVVKRPSISPIDHKNWPSEYQVPAIVENGHNSLNYSTLGHGSIGHNLVSQSSVSQSSGHSSLGHNPVSHNPISHNPISHNSISHNSISHNSISHNAVSQNHVGLNPVSHSSVSHNSVSHNSVVQSSVGQSSVSPHTWNINPEYTNLVSNAWPSAMDPDELRRRLLNSFK